MTPAWPHGDPRDVVRAIVADPRFRLDAVPIRTQRTWLDELRDWLGQLVRRFFHLLDHALGERNPLDTVIGFGLIVAAFALLGYVVYAVVRASGRRSKRHNAAVPFEPLDATERDAAALRLAALAAARAGRYRDAAALLFVSAVRALDERGRVAYDPARTPGEYRRIVRDPAFDALAADAVVALFAAAEPHDELFARMNRSYDRFFADAVTR